MRTVTLAVLLLLATAVVPSPGSAGCRVDLGDPTNPRLYGECLELRLAQTQGQGGQQEWRAGAGADLAFDAPVSGICEDDRCDYSVAQYFFIRVTPREDGAVPFVDFRSEGGAYGVNPIALETPCVTLDPLTGVFTRSTCGHP